MALSTHVARTVGFGREFEFVAEVTAEVMTGEIIVVKEFGHTEWGALARAESAAAGKLTARKRRAGFYSGGFEYLTGTSPATFEFGFRGGAA
jgi:hypothetical protein